MRKKPVIPLLCVLLSLLWTVVEVQAADRALIVLGGFDQWVDLTYQFDGQQTTSRQTTSRSQNYFKEEYNIKTSYYVWNPRILRGKLSAGVGLDQTIAHSSDVGGETTSGTNFKYYLTGALLERSPYPLHFFSQSEYIHAQREFSIPYDIKIDRNGFNFALKNRRLPVKVDYIRTTSETTGLLIDRIQHTDSLSLGTFHQIKDVSDTEGRILYNRTTSEAKPDGSQASTRSYEVRLRNQFFLAGVAAGRTLTSEVRFREEHVVQDIKTFTYEEQLVMPLGRALTTGANYIFVKRDLALGTDQYHNGHIWLQHKFLESLWTQLDGDYRRDDLTTGMEQNASETVSLHYQKILPADSSLQVDLSQQYLWTDRDAKDAALQVLDEPHQAVINPVTPGIFAPITLRNPNVVPESIVVRNADPAVRLLPYLVNFDYRFDTATGQIIIIPTGEIRAGDNLLITYVCHLNPQATYSTSSRRIAFSLLLFNNAYRLGGSWFTSDQELLSGRADFVRLNNQAVYKLGLEANRFNFSYGAEYENVDSDQDKHQTVQGFVRYQTGFRRSSLSLYSTDSFTRTEASDFTGPNFATRNVNTLSMGGVFNAQLFSTAQMMLSAKYFNISGDALSRNDVSLGCDLRWNYGKMFLSLLSQVNWRSLPGTTTRDEYVRFNLTRYF